MKKHFTTIILSSVIFILLLTVALLILTKDPWEARLKGLVGDYNNLVATNSIITEELNLLKQEKEEKATSTDETNKIATSSIEGFLNPDYKILRVLTSPDSKYFLMIIREPKDENIKVSWLGDYDRILCPGFFGFCNFVVGETEWFSEEYWKKDFSDYEFKEFELKRDDGPHTMDVSSVKFIDNETIEYLTCWDSSGSCSTRITNLDVTSGEIKEIKDIPCSSDIY